jgi:hypothetical protein
MTADAIDLCQASTTRARQTVQDAVLLSAHRHARRNAPIELPQISREERPWFVMLSLAWPHLCLLAQASFPMTRSLAVAEAAVSGLEVFMAAGFAPPTSGAGLCVLGDTLTCLALSQAAR